MADTRGDGREHVAARELPDPELINQLKDLAMTVADAGRRLQQARSAPSDAQLAAIMEKVRDRG